MKKNLLIAICLLSLCSCNINDTNPNSELESEISNESSSNIESSSTLLCEGYEVISHDDFNNYKLGFFKTFGRNYILSNELVLDNSASGGEYYFYGSESSITLTPSTTLYLKVFIDDDTIGTTYTIAKNKSYKIASDLSEGIHYVRFVKLNSTFNGTIKVLDISCDGNFINKQNDYNLNIEFVGDSITCGAGILGKSSDSPSIANTDVTKAYSYLTAKELNASYAFNSVCGMCVVAKTALAFNMIETYPCYSYSYRGKYDFNNKNDIVVISLGTNDAYYCGGDKSKLDEFKQGYIDLLTLVRQKNKDAKIICTYGLMNNSTSIKNNIIAAIESLNDTNISYLQMPQDNNGAESHPSIEGAIKQKDTLVNYIKEIINNEE